MPEQDIQLRIAEVLELSTTFGGQDKIPKEELERVGYKRVKLYRGTRLRPLNREVHVQPMDQTDKVVESLKETVVFQETVRVEATS